MPTCCNHNEYANEGPKSGHQKQTIYNRKDYLSKESRKYTACKGYQPVDPRCCPVATNL